jgi:hypothetical protein
MIGIPFHADAGFPPETVSVSRSEGEAAADTVNIGIAVGFGWIRFEHAAKTSMSSSKLATMDFFTRPSL